MGAQALAIMDSLLIAPEVSRGEPAAATTGLYWARANEDIRNRHGEIACAIYLERSGIFAQRPASGSEGIRVSRI